MLDESEAAAIAARYSLGDGAALSGPVEFASADVRRARTLYDAYVDAGGTARIDRPGNFSMAIAQIHHIAELDCEAWLDPAASEQERQRRIPRVAEFIDRPLTRSVIDDLLAALPRR